MSCETSANRTAATASGRAGVAYNASKCAFAAGVSQVQAGFGQVKAASQTPQGKAVATAFGYAGATLAGHRAVRHLRGRPGLAGSKTGLAFVLGHAAWAARKGYRTTLKRELAGRRSE